MSIAFVLRTGTIRQGGLCGRGFGVSAEIKHTTQKDAMSAGYLDKAIGKRPKVFHGILPEQFARAGEAGGRA